LLLPRLSETRASRVVGADGVLSVVAPLGPAEANREVRVTVEPVADRPSMTPEE
jgi:hypothetical protein